MTGLLHQADVSIVSAISFMNDMLQHRTLLAPS
jgi:hypothetical protein